MKLKVQGFSRKVTKISSIQKGREEEVEITEVFTLPKEEYEEFANDLLDSYYWLKDTEGCVLVKCEQGTGTVVVKTEGYDYARYTALIKE